MQLISHLAGSWLGLVALAGPLAAATPEAAPPPAVELSATKPCRLFLLGGQSNMDGCGRPHELPEAYRMPPKNVVTWDNRRKCWVRLTEDSMAIARNGMFGPEMTFAHRLAEAFPNETIAITKTSTGGTRLFTQWIPEGGMYQRFIANSENARKALKDAGISYSIGGMLWMQGESDTDNLEHAQAYEENLRRMFADVRRKTGIDQLPIVMGRISSSLLKGTPWNMNHVPVVRAAQDAVAAADPHVHLISTDDLSTWKDNTHFDGPSQLTLGSRMADAMLKELDPTAASRSETP